MQANNKTKTKTIGVLLRFMYGSKLLIALSAIFMLLGVFVSYLMPQVTSFTIDYLLDNQELPSSLEPLVNFFGGLDFLKQNFLIVGAVVLVLALVQAVLAYFRRICSTQGAERISKRMRDTLYSHIQQLPFSWHTSISTGDIIQRATQDSDLVKRYIASQFVELFRLIAMLSVGITIMLMMNVKMTLVALSFTPVLVGFSAIFFPKISKRFKDVDEAEGALTTTLQENLTGLRVVRAFGQQQSEQNRFEKKNREYEKMWVQFSKTLSVFWGSGDFFSAFQTLIILVVGTYMAKSNQIMLGELMAFIFYNHMLVWPLRNIGRILAETGKMKVSVNRLNEILDAKPEQDQENEIDANIEGNIEFKNVSFSYDHNRKILDNISFEVEKGSVFAIIGATGSGKSTLVQLINRMYDNYDGEIFIDGVDIKNIKRSTLRRKIGLILQEPFLFSKNIEQNIALAAGSPSYDNIRKYASIASLDSTIAELEDGFDTVVGEKGVTLSGGQKQRLVIARALITEPKIIVFDDSLSAVDTETDFKIRKSLSENLEQTTVILISHRISSVMNADKIMVLNDGKIEAIGTHDELVKAEGTYKRLFELQTMHIEE